MSESNARKKIVILGGGVGAMAAAYAITEQPGWQERYEVTLYQLGWRLGGKGASGRNARSGHRIEEHGLHIWLGFYENAFAMIRRCYDELARKPGEPLATWQDAFKPHSLVVFEEQIDGYWKHWPCEYPTNDSLPGDGGLTPAAWEYIPMILGWMRGAFANSSHYEARRESLPDEIGGEPPHWWDQVVSSVESFVGALSLDAAGLFLEAAYHLARSLDPDPRHHHRYHHDAITGLVERFIRWLWRRVEREVEHDDLARHLFAQIDIAAAVVTGMIADGVIFNGFDVIDDLDLRDWLRKHGASERISINSAWVRAAYDLVFGFRGGNPRKPAVAAGTGLRGTLRMVLGYKGAIMWKMQAGMGDTIFAPMYQVLKRRGVKFEFFHRVRSLAPSPDGRSIDRITLGRQVTLKRGDYDPLVTVKGLPSWPSEPLYDQIVEGRQLQEGGINLESYWTPWQDVATVTLERGTDFDLVVLGISLGALPTICSELIAVNDSWRNMVEQVQTCRTQAFQLWLTPSLAELGWETSPIAGGFVEPLDTWADMSHLIDREAWEGGDSPRNIAYFCGPLEDDPEEPPYFTDPDYPAREASKVKTRVIQFLTEHVGHLWPGAIVPETGEINWNLLVDPEGRQGPARLDAQYWVANIDPTERYVLMVPGSTQYRLPSDQSGFDNLYLAGDWTRNGLNAGCVEAAVMSGLQVSRAITGSPAEIVGETDIRDQRPFSTEQRG